VPEKDQRDHELLKLAAKAAGLGEVMVMPMSRTEVSYVVEETDGGPLRPWNPLDDDGDALRLAVLMGRADRLGIQIHIVEPFDGDSDPYTVVDAERFGEFDIYHGDDPFRATRRAIVEAAAAIGSKS